MSYSVSRVQNNVERVQHYNELQVEAAPSLASDPKGDWPKRGEVVFDNVEMRYREDLPLVLKNLSFRINAGEKVNRKNWCIADISGWDHWANRGWEE